MKILIVPTVREIYKNQFEYCVDLKLIDFLKKIFTNTKIEIYNNTLENNYNLIVFIGGNNSVVKKKRDLIRNVNNNKIYNFAIKKKIKLLGICHGAQFLAKKFAFKLQKENNHVGNHKVLFHINGLKFKKIVNSYHNDTIKINKTKDVNIFGIAQDNTVEAFHVKKKKILGIMWHPERYIKIKKFDQNLIKKFYATNSIVSR